MSIHYSVVVPVYNEEDLLVDFYNELSRVMRSLDGSFEIIFATGGNTDTSLHILRQLNEKDKSVKVINLSHRFDYQAALNAGIDYARGDAVITMDGDFQHPPEVIPELVHELEGGYDIVYTVRDDASKKNLFKKLTSRIFYYFLGLLTKVEFEENAADFRIMSRKVVEAFKQYTERKRYIPGIICSMGFNRKGIRYTSPKRPKGISKFSFSRMLALALDSIFSFSNIPIKVVTFMGLIMTLLSMVYLIYVIVTRLLQPEASVGWASILASILFLSSVQITILGLLGEYIGRIYEETKRRPIYLIDELIGF